MSDTYLTLNGARYHITRAGGGPPLLLLHGFTGSAQSWRPHLQPLAQDFSLIAPDFPGHGSSDAPANAARYSIEHCTADLVALVNQLELSRIHLLGYSMGGRVALHFALCHPERVARLVLTSASPGLADPQERAQRAASDAALAEKIEREGVPSFVEFWTNLPLFATQKNLPEPVRTALYQQRLHNRAHGLANSLRGLSVGVQPSLWDQLPNLNMPTLLLAGALDQKFAIIAQTMSQAIPNAQLAIIPHAGHTVYLEQPDQFDQLVLQFLTQSKIEI